MAASSLPEPPAPLKALQSYMKVASDIERIDPVVSYWVRLYATESGFKIDKDSMESKTFLLATISWLEQFKKTHADNEAILNPTVGQAHYENFVVALFTKADTLDRAGTANKNTVRMFYMAAVLFEAMGAFGPLTDDVSEKAKYAKFKAAYIQKCLKAGLTPKAGPLEGADLLDQPSDELSNINDSNEPPNPKPGAPNEENKPSKPDPYILTPSSAPNYPPASSTTMPMPPSTPISKPTTGYSQPSATNTANTSSTTTTITTTSTINATKFHATNGAPLNPEDIITGQKYCKFANSALQYDDIPTAVANLEKALKLLTTGQKSN